MNVKEIAKELRGQDVWSMELLEQLCEEAGMLEEYEAADGETFKSRNLKNTLKLQKLTV